MDGFQTKHLTDLKVIYLSTLGKGRASTVSVCCETVPLKKKKKKETKGQK